MAISRGPRIVKDGLVLALDAADRNSYPGSGSTWYDLSGNGNHGTSSSFQMENNTAVFNGTSDNWIINNTTALQNDLKSNQTVEFFLYVDAGSNNLRRNPIHKNFSAELSITLESNLASSYYWGGDTNNDSGIYCNATAGSNNAGLFNTGEWFHLVITRDIPNGIVKFYNNSNMTKQRSTCSPNTYSKVSNDNLLIGTGYAGYFKGKIGFIKLYNRALSAAEIQQNYNTTKGRFNL